MLMRCVGCQLASKREGILAEAEGFKLFKGRVYCRRCNPENFTTPEQRAETERKLRALGARAREHDAIAPQPVKRMTHAESGTLAEFLGAQTGHTGVISP
jgi:hypothetical protein